MLTDGSVMYLEKEQFEELLHKPVLDLINQNDLIELKKTEDKLVILDVRMANEFTHGHMEGAINIPLSQLREALPGLDKEAAYVVVCDGGRRSEAGAYLLTEAGLRAAALKI
jgi:rhodanese-related sulfurtransferase